MKATVVYNGLALEVEIQEELLKKIDKLGAEPRKQAIEKIAVAHLRRFGDKLGFCISEKVAVRLRECLDCSVRQGNTKISVWEACKSKNVKPCNEKMI
jgi:hypothetical protein